MNVLTENIIPMNMRFQERGALVSVKRWSDLHGNMQRSRIKSLDDNKMPQSFYAGDYRLPIAVELGNRSGQITTSTARFDSADTVLDNRYLNVTLGSGQNSGGLTGTINNCKVVSYNVNSAQADFSLSDWTLLITSQEAEQSVKGGSLPSWV